jgi:hypothetical protein
VDAHHEGQHALDRLDDAQHVVGVGAKSLVHHARQQRAVEAAGVWGRVRVCVVEELGHALPGETNEISMKLGTTPRRRDRGLGSNHLSARYSRNRTGSTYRYFRSAFSLASVGSLRVAFDAGRPESDRSENLPPKRKAGRVERVHALMRCSACCSQG